MSLLTHDELVELVQKGVITNVRMDQINGASIDVTLGNVLWIEDNQHGQYNVVDLAQKETPHMMMVSMLSTGYYDLQPGGFCLAGTRETFNLPNDLAAEFRLKSSLARAGLDAALAMWCFTGDTEIPLLDGTSKPIAELVGTEPWVYALSLSGEVVPAKAINIRMTHLTHETVTVLLDNGESFTCTPNHLVMLRNGTYKPAGSLVPEQDTVMPFARRQSYGYEQVYCPKLAETKNGNQRGRWAYTHRQVAARSYPVEGVDGLVVHHVDHNPANNSPENLQLMLPDEHFAHHNRFRTQQEDHKVRSSERMTARLTEDWKDTEKRAVMIERCRDNAIANNAKRWSEEESRRKASEWNKSIQAHNAMRRWIDENPVEHRRRLCLSSVAKVVDKLIAESMPVTPESYTQYKRQNMHTVARIEELFGSFDSALDAIGYENHTVVAVVKNDHDYDPIPVYDMEVPTYHNFAIGAGLFVHNCDPGWHGSVLTLELTNALKMHSLRFRPGLKIGQMVFHRGAPVPAHASYAVRGRYNSDLSATPSKGVK